MQPEIDIQASPQLLAATAALRIVRLAAECTAARGVFSIALSGGSSPEMTYTLLATPEYRSQVDWQRVRVFFGDERYVGRTDERSNFKMAYDSLLSHVPLSSDSVFPVNTALPSVQHSAASYSSTLQATLPPTPAGVPCFDLVLLGLGDDGHTASLFPGKPATAVNDRWAVATSPGVLPPQVDRVTLTFPVLNSACTVLFLVSGAKKAKIVEEILGHKPQSAGYPSSRVAPANGTLVWMLDNDSAGLLDQP